MKKWDLTLVIKLFFNIFRVKIQKLGCNAALTLFVPKGGKFAPLPPQLF